MKLTNIIGKEYKPIKRKRFFEDKKPSSTYPILVEKYQLWFKECSETQKRNVEKLGKYHIGTMVNEKYDIAKKILEDITSQCTPEDISQLSETNVPFDYCEQFTESGLFFSALINMHYNLHKDDSTQILYNVNFEKHHQVLYGIDGPTLSGIGYYLNGATINIQGNVGDFLGYHMSSGKIIVIGNANDAVGAYMSGGLIHIIGDGKDYVGFQMNEGEIIIEKNVGEHLGQKMFGGKIMINGDSKRYIGQYMKGGEMYIEGTLKKKGFTHGAQKGTIFHKGKKVFYDGKNIFLERKK